MEQVEPHQERWGMKGRPHRHSSFKLMSFQLIQPYEDDDSNTNRSCDTRNREASRTSINEEIYPHPLKNKPDLGREHVRKSNWAIALMQTLNRLTSILYGFFFVATRLSLALAAEPEAPLGFGDEASNNLFSDLGPLLSLFGEQVAKQFMASSTTWEDNVLFAMVMTLEEV